VGRRFPQDPKILRTEIVSLVTEMYQSLRRRPLLLVLVAAVPVVEYLARRGGGPGPSIALLRNPFAAIAAASVFCRYLFCDSRRRARKWIVYLSPLVVGLALDGLRRGEPIQIAMMNMLVGLGVLGVIGFALAAHRAPESEEKSGYLERMVDALLLPVAASLVSFGLWSTGHINPVYDARIYAFEQILGIDFSRLFVGSYHLLAPLSRLATGCYSTIALGIVLVAAAQKNTRREADILTAAVIAGACGFALYFVCPAAGPFEAFGPAYPYGLPPALAGAPLMMVVSGSPRNAMPSLHTVWALLIWFNAGSLPSALRRGLRLFVLMNLWAAMGLQEHWIMDIVVACPLAVAIQFAVVGNERGSRRWMDVAACATVMGIWLLGFRSATRLLQMPAVLAWMAVAITVCWPLLRLRRSSLMRASADAAASPSIRAVDAQQVNRRFHEVLES
jgi:hypothetical protein